MLGVDELNGRFDYHEINPETLEKIKKARNSIKGLATYLDSMLPDGRYKSMFMTDLESALTWASKSLVSQERESKNGVSSPST